VILRQIHDVFLRKWEKSAKYIVYFLAFAILGKIHDVFLRKWEKSAKYTMYLAGF
jgi:hypothetical protein